MMNQDIARSFRPGKRLSYAMAVILLLYFWGQLHSGLGAQIEPYFVFRLIMTALVTAMWAIHTIARLVDLRRSRWWFFLYLTLWVATAWTASTGHRLWIGVTLPLVLALQVPLIVIPARDNAAPTKPVESGDS